MMSDFTAQDYRQLSEALEQYDEDCSGSATGLIHRAYAPEYTDVLASAARRFRDRYQICQTCDGDGWFMPSGNHSLAELANMKGEDCDDCVGGLVPNQERIQQAAEAIMREDKQVPYWSDCDEMMRAWYLGTAAAAVRAFDKEPT